MELGAAPGAGASGALSLDRARAPEARPRRGERRQEAAERDGEHGHHDAQGRA